MRALRDMETIQVEITNACINQCSNCTRLVGHHQKPYFMGMDMFKKAVDSLVDYPKMVGIMGGEPLLHPQFEDMCHYLHERILPEQCGLWTCFPEGKERYRDVICETFGNIFLNDHSRNDVLHGPILVPAKEVCAGDYDSMWYLIDHCWVQNGWSASINPMGGFFCEVAAALALLYGRDDLAWEVKEKWWEKTPAVDFKNQASQLCPMCGCAMPLKRRPSTDGVDDISASVLEDMKSISPKVKAGKYVVHDLKCAVDTRKTASYKDEKYRMKIADRYGIFLMVNDRGYQTPYLRRSWNDVDKNVA